MNKLKPYLVPAIGAVAFVIGGYFTRAATLDKVETIQDRFAKDRKKSEAPEA